MIEMPCPHCGQRLQIEDKYAGQRGACKHCRGEVVVPSSPPSGGAVDPFAKTDLRVALQSREDAQKGGDIPFGEAPVADPFARSASWDRETEVGPPRTPSPGPAGKSPGQDESSMREAVPFGDGDDWEAVDTSAFGPPPGTAPAQLAEGKLGRFIKGLGRKLRPTN